jgi:hypothetical protein
MLTLTLMHRVTLAACCPSSTLFVVVCNGIPRPEPAQISAGSIIRVFSSGTKAKLGGNNDFGRHCGQFSVGRGTGNLTVKVRRGAHAVFDAICGTSLLLFGHIL